MTILASPMLGTLDVSLHEDAFTFAEVLCRAKTEQIVKLHSINAPQV